MYAILLFQKQLQKNLCGCYIRCIELIYRLHDNLPGWLLTGPKSFMNWRYKTGRSGNQVRREAVRITGHQVPRYVGLGACTVLQQSWAGKQCMRTCKSSYWVYQTTGWVGSVVCDSRRSPYCIAFPHSLEERELVWEIHEDHGKRWSGETSLQNWVALKQAKGVKCYNAGLVSTVLFSCC